MKNMFENAYFGKPYITRDGHKAVFYNHHNTHAREKTRYVTMILEGKESIYKWYYDGKAVDCQEHLDIIFDKQEEIDENELEKCASSLNPYEDINYPTEEMYGKRIGFNEGFIMGYRKARLKL